MTDPFTHLKARTERWALIAKVDANLSARSQGLQQPFPEAANYTRKMIAWMPVVHGIKAASVAFPVTAVTGLVTLAYGPQALDDWSNWIVLGFLQGLAVALLLPLLPLADHLLLRLVFDRRAGDGE